MCERIAAVLFAAFLLTGCIKKESGTAASTPPSTPSSSGTDVSEAGPTPAHTVESPATVHLNTAGFKSGSIDTAPLKANAHRKYLSDLMKFAALPDQGIPQGSTAVVGSKICKFYPDASLDSANDLDTLPAGVSVPFATILAINGEKVMNAGDKEGLFHFEDNWNWFYPATFQGSEGLVFGADLYGLGDTNEENRVSSMLYRTGGKLKEFYPILGYRPLSTEIAARIEKDRVAFQSMTPSEYSLSGYLPDDMISLYSGSLHAPGWGRKIPLFITTDLAAHAQHLMFDRTLQYIEETFFFSRLQALVSGFLEDLKGRESRADSYRETFEKAVLYFQVAKALLDLAPERIVATDDGGQETVTYKDRDRDAVLEGYPREVRLEISRIDAASGIMPSFVFTFKDGTTYTEDYSQYKPRGHYTKNGVLAAYFKAMMWFGRIQFLIAREGETPLGGDMQAVAGGPASARTDQSSDSTALTLTLEPIALLITDLVKNDGKLYKAWGGLFDPLTALIGLSDDLSFYEIMPLWKDASIRDFGVWAAKKENLLAFMERARTKLRPPAISGSSVFWGPSEGAGHVQPMGWRLFGQRFTWDSAIHQQVSSPRLAGRDMVRGLDIMKAFGSRTADELLQSSDYPVVPGLQEALGALEKEFDSRGPDFWSRTYYTNVLYQVKTQAQFEPGTGFFFTETPAWGVKAMLSAHGTWAELRHDTILYAKMSAAEAGGFGEIKPTFRTEPIPNPVHYLEPNVRFWQGSLTAVQTLMKTLDSFDLLDEESDTDFGKLRELYSKAVDVASAEAQDKPLSAEDISWIAGIPSMLSGIVLTHSGGQEVDDVDQLKMACIADVSTNAQRGEVLETGVGIPFRIYVALNDGQGGKRIALGYTYNYYEFAYPAGDRMTDDAWKAIVYDPSSEMDGFRPFWAGAIALPPEPQK